jgi:hypothetical protein
MKSPTPIWSSILITAGIATAATTAVVAFLGKRETGSAAAPLNATSHIAWGEEAATHDEVDAKHTGTGVVLNASAMLAWAAVQDLVLGSWVRRGSRGRALVAGAATAAAAYVTDYFLVPKRFTPGFEKRLSKPALGVIYTALAASLAAGAAIPTYSGELEAYLKE